MYLIQILLFFFIFSYFVFGDAFTKVELLLSVYSKQIWKPAQRFYFRNMNMEKWRLDAFLPITACCCLLKLKVWLLSWGQHALSFKISLGCCLALYLHVVCTDACKAPNLCYHYNVVVSTLPSRYHSLLLSTLGLFAILEGRRCFLFTSRAGGVLTSPQQIGEQAMWTPKFEIT